MGQASLISPAKTPAVPEWFEVPSSEWRMGRARRQGAAKRTTGLPVSLLGLSAQVSNGLARDAVRATSVCRTPLRAQDVGVGRLFVDRVVEHWTANSRSGRGRIVGASAPPMLFDQSFVPVK